MNALPGRLRNSLIAAFTRLRLLRLGKAGRGVVIEPGVLLSYPRRIHLGHGARIARNVALRANSRLEPGIVIGDRCTVQDGALLNASEGFVHVGDRTWVGPFASSTATVASGSVAT